MFSDDDKPADELLVPVAGTDGMTPVNTAAQHSLEVIMIKIGHSLRTHGMGQASCDSIIAEGRQTQRQQRSAKRTCQRAGFSRCVTASDTHVIAIRSVAVRGPALELIFATSRRGEPPLHATHAETGLLQSALSSLLIRWASIDINRTSTAIGIEC